MNEQTLNALTALATKLGTTSEYLWGVLIRQASIDAATSLVFLTAVGVVLTMLTVHKVAFNSIVYDARSRESRALADWWEEHQEADKRRREAEAKALAAEASARAPGWVDFRLVKSPDRLRSIANLPNSSGAVHAELRQIADLIERHLAKL